jgi:hypothetical protein
MITPLVASYIALATSPDLLVCARFYNAGKQKSRYALYLFQSNSKRKLATKSEPIAGQWVTRDRVVWLEEDGLWTSQISPWRPMAIPKTKSAWFVESRYRDLNLQGCLIDIDEKKYRLNSETLRLEAYSSQQSELEVSFSEDQPAQVNDLNGGLMTLKSFENVVVQRNGEAKSTEWEPLRAWYSKDKSKLWLLHGARSSATGSINNLIYFSKGNGYKVIFENANCYDFTENRSSFAFCTARSTSPLGNKRVWSSELHVGDWRAGTQRVLLKGAVHVPSVSLRP